MTARHRRTNPSRRSIVATISAAVSGMLIAGGLLAGSTSAAYVDQANLNVGENGIGNPHPFDIALVHDGVLKQAKDDAVAWELTPSGAVFVPGSIITATIPVVNNGPYSAAVGLSVRDVYDETADGGRDPFALYRWTVVDADTTEVLAGDPDAPLTGGVPAADLATAVVPFTLAARGGAPIADGDAWTAGAVGSARTVTIIVAYPDTAGSELFNGGKSKMQIVFSAESI